MREHVARALTVAGSDSGGGAGIQADLKTMHQFRVYGMSVVTALTAQNTLGVQGIYEVSPGFVRLQLEAVFADLGADALKTGMLANADIIRTVAAFLRGARSANLVVDPVMVAKGGSRLLAEDSVQSLAADLLPLAAVVTPNLPEAEALCGYPLRNWADCHRAARDIAGLGPKIVVIKGGHMPSGLFADEAGEWEKRRAGADPFGENPAVDLVYADGRFTYFAARRIDSRRTHGTGCTFSAAVASMLARGAPALAAIAAAKAFTHAAVSGARDWDVGAGCGPTDHFAPAPDWFEPVPGHFHLLRGGRWTVGERGGAE